MNSNILKKALLLISLLMMTNLAWGQRSQGPPPQPNPHQISQMVNELTTALELSEKQSSRISKLYRDHFDEMKSMMSKKSGKKRPDHATMEHLRQEFEAQVKQVLSPDQIEAYDNFLKSHSPQSGQRKRKG